MAVFWCRINTSVLHTCQKKWKPYLKAKASAYSWGNDKFCSPLLERCWRFVHSRRVQCRQYLQLQQIIRLQVINKFTIAINHSLLNVLPIKYSQYRVNYVSTGKIYNTVWWLSLFKRQSKKAVTAHPLPIISKTLRFPWLPRSNYLSYKPYLETVLGRSHRNILQLMIQTNPFCFGTWPHTVNSLSAAHCITYSIWIMDTINKHHKMKIPLTILWSFHSQNAVLEWNTFYCSYHQGKYLHTSSQSSYKNPFCFSYLRAFMVGNIALGPVIYILLIKG